MTEEILIKLATISSIEKGQTLSTCYETPVTHNSWSTSFSRTYNGEHRKKTINYIKDVFERALIILEDLNKDEGYTILVNLIKDALIGVENLKTTYKGDYYIIGLINTLVEETNRHLYNDQSNKIDIDKIDIDKIDMDKIDIKEPAYTLNHQVFFEAIKNSDYSTLEEYLYDGKEPNLKTLQQQNGLHLVADKQYYHEQILNILLNFNVDVYAKDVYGNTPLYYAISTGNIKCIIKLEEFISHKKREQL